MLFFNLAGAQQDTLALNLEESIRIALENNLNLNYSKLAKDRSRVDRNQAWANLLPDLNGSYNAGVSNGRSINPYTNAYINQELTFSNAGLSLDAMIFNGFQLVNRIRQSSLNLKASEMELEEARQNLILNVTLAYLQVLNNRDLVELAANRLETTNEQVARLRTLYGEEVGNPADYTDILGQSALDRNGIIQAQNNLQTSILNLKELLNITYEIETEEIAFLIDFEDYPLTAEEVYSEAMQNLPAFKAGNLRIEAAEKGVNVARSLYVPQVSLFAQLNTNYSSAAEFFIETGTVTRETGQYVTLDGENLPVFAEQTLFEEERITYSDQFENNLNSVVGVSVNIPFLNGFRARNQVTLEKINLQESQVAFDETKLQFRQAIQQAHNDMQAAYERYYILVEQVEAYEESFRINEIRFNSGVSTVVEYTISKNNLDMARINLANARYEYLLRVKILEYYRGNIYG